MTEKTTSRLCAIAGIYFAAVTVLTAFLPETKTKVEAKPDAKALNIFVYGQHTPK